MKRLLLIYNPMSGDGRIQNSLSNVIYYYTKEGYEVVVHPTLEPCDAMNHIEQNGRRFDLIVAAGGDGILHESVNGLARIGFETRLGYLPAGTTNDFASTHTIPLDLMEAARCSIAENQKNVDLGKFNDEYFAYVAACGIGTHVSYDTPQEDKRKFGPLAYIVNGLSSVDYTHWENNCVTLNVQWDAGSVEGDFVFCSISNSQYIGGSDKFIDDWFSWNDGLLEGFLIRRPMNLTDLNMILAGIMRKDYSSPYFVQVQSPWFRIQSEPADWTLDGEYGGNHSEVFIETIREALPLVLQKNEDA